MTESRLRIGVLLPGVLGTYSDTGNALVLAQRARWRGIETEVVHVSTSDIPPTSCDLYLLGGGEDLAQHFAVSWLRRFPALLHVLDTSAVTLAVCAGMQILGTTVTDVQGHEHAGLGLLDLTTVPGRRRAVGEVITRCRLPEVGLLTGFENHLGATTLGPGLAPLGQVLAGVGNEATRLGQRVDGALTDRVVATYLHGPLLARNPDLADHLLSSTVGRPLPDLQVADQSEVRGTYLRGAGHRPRLRRAWSARRR